MSIYSKVPIKKPGRNVFNLSHAFSTTANIGELRPICRPILCIPGDTHITGNISKVELSPLITNFKGELNFETWQFFVSLDSLYETSDAGKFTDILASIQDPKNILSLPYYADGSSIFNNNRNVLNALYGITKITQPLANRHVSTYPSRALRRIYNEWFRDENLQSEISAGGTYSQLYVNYKKDRYTSAFLTTQKGNTLKMKTRITFDASKIIDFSEAHTPVGITNGWIKNGDLGYKLYPNDNSDTLTSEQNTTFLKGISENISKAITEEGISINDLRLYNKLQKWQERNQLCGNRLKEYLLANYGVTPDDETLDRPVLIGHTKTPVIVNEIVSNIANTNITGSDIDNKRGSRGGIGNANSSFKYGKYFCKEFGYIITLGALRPKSRYIGGIHPTLRQKNIVDYFNPIFQHLGQQPILNGELNFTNTNDDDNIFGFQDIYNELRHLEDNITPEISSTYPEKYLFRKFANTPTLSSSFIQVNPSEYDYLFQISSSTAPQAFIDSYNIIKSIRPITKMSNPNLL